MLALDEDWHVHSTQSDGRSSPEANIAAAGARGLRRMVCVDHVRRETRWVPDFVEHLARLERPSSLRLEVGVEAKFLDARGSLDLPPLPPEVRVYAADHQVPMGDGAYAPAMIRSGLESGSLSVREVIAESVYAVLHAMARRDELVIAHLWSVLPKVGIGDASIQDEDIREVARRAKDTGAIIELDERWRAPTPRVSQILFAEGVQLVASSDAHHASAVGQYTYVRALHDAWVHGAELPTWAQVNAEP